MKESMLSKFDNVTFKTIKRENKMDRPCSANEWQAAREINDQHDVILELKENQGY